MTQMVPIPWIFIMDLILQEDWSRDYRQKNSFCYSYGGLLWDTLLFNEYRILFFYNTLGMEECNVNFFKGTMGNYACVVIIQ